MHGITLFIKRSSFLFVVLSIALGIVSFKLYRSNKAYQQRNRSLLIQNDSILSVNIQLINALETRKTGIAVQNNKEEAKKK